MPRPPAIRHDDVLGRLDWIESQMDEMRPKSRVSAEINAAMLEDAYPVQMRAPGVFPDEGEKIPASETFAVVDSIRAKREGELRHEHPLHPMEMPPTDALAAEATRMAHEGFDEERALLEGAGKGRKASDAKVEAVHRAENDAVGNPVTGARTGELPAGEVMGVDVPGAAEHEAGTVSTKAADEKDEAAPKASSKRSSDDKAKGKE